MRNPPPAACTFTVPVLGFELPLDVGGVEVTRLLVLPPPPQPAIITSATTNTAAVKPSRSIRFLFDLALLFPAIIIPPASANEPSLQGNKCGKSRGARRPARVVGAVIVTVALPEVVSEFGETAHAVPGNDAGTLHVSATPPVNPCSGEMNTVVVPELPTVPAASVIVDAKRDTWKSAVGAGAWCSTR